MWYKSHTQDVRCACACGRVICFNTQILTNVQNLGKLRKAHLKSQLGVFQEWSYKKNILFHFKG